MINVLREIDSLIEFLEAKRKLNQTEIKSLMSKLSRQRKTLAGRFEPVIEKTLNIMGERAEQAFRAYLMNESLREADWDRIRKILEAMGISAFIIPQLRADYQGFYQEVFHQTYGTIFNHIGAKIGLTMGAPDPAVRKIMEQVGKRIGLLDLDGQTKDKLFELLAQGRDEGLGVDALARLIRDQIPAGPWANARIRSQIIAKTETKYAQNMSAIESYRQSDAVTGLQAMDNLTGFDDEECMARDGQVFSFDDAEQEEQDEHPNGTLTWAPYTGDDV